MEANSFSTKSLTVQSDGFEIGKILQCFSSAGRAGWISPQDAGMVPRECGLVAKNNSLLISNDIAASVGTTGTGPRGNETGSNSVCIGPNTSCGTAAGAVAIGAFSTVEDGCDNAVALGPETSCGGAESVAIGYQASTQGGIRGISIGNNASATGDNAIAIGFEAEALAQNSIAIGDQARSAATRSIAVGKSANCDVNSRCIAIGTSTMAIDQASIAIGTEAKAQSIGALTNAISIGYKAESANRGIAIGTEANAVFSDSVSVGTGVIAVQTNSFNCKPRQRLIAPSLGSLKEVAPPGRIGSFSGKEFVSVPASLPDLSFLSCDLYESPNAYFIFTVEITNPQGVVVLDSFYRFAGICTKNVVHMNGKFNMESVIPWSGPRSFELLLSTTPQFLANFTANGQAAGTVATKTSYGGTLEAIPSSKRILCNFLSDDFSQSEGVYVSFAFENLVVEF